MAHPSYDVLHLTTVHGRGDTRIARREGKTLARTYPGAVGLVVADGCGCCEATGDTMGIIDVGRPPGGRAGRMILGSWRVFQVVRKTRPVVVHVHDPELVVIGLIFRISGFCVIYDVHEDFPAQIRYKHWLPKLLRTPVGGVASLVHRVVGRVFDGVVAATPAIARSFPNERTWVVQNFPPRELAERPQHLPYTERPHGILYVGSLEAVRGAREMLVGLERVSRKDVVLDIAGRISPAALGTSLVEYPAWSRVRFHGWVSEAEVFALLDRARVGLVLFHPHPNHFEAQPTKLFEYMAAGLPVVASDFPHWRSLVKDAGSGLLVDPFDPKAIARAIDWILDHPEDAKRMGERGRVAIQECYNWDQESKKLLDLYRRLLPVCERECHE